MIERQNSANADFKRLVVEAQADLFSFISLMVGNTADARDVLQNTNLALLKKNDQYETDRPFRAWARSIAYYEVLTFRQRQKRERLVFNDDVLDQLSAKIIAEDADERQEERRQAALAHCLSQLSPAQRTLVTQRYGKGRAVREMARRHACSETAVSTLLYRIRKLLADCIRFELGKEALP